MLEWLKSKLRKRAAEKKLVAAKNEVYRRYKPTLDALAKLERDEDFQAFMSSPANPSNPAYQYLYQEPAYDSGSCSSHDYGSSSSDSGSSDYGSCDSGGCDSGSCD